MKKLGSLGEITSWCSSATRGDTAEFSVAGMVTQEEASQLAGEINKERADHIWIDARPPVQMPEPTTEIHVRCSY